MRTELHVVRDIAREGPLATDLPRTGPRLDGTRVNATRASPEPLGGAAPHPAGEGRAVVRQHVLHAHEPERREFRLQLGANAGNICEDKCAHEVGFAAVRNDADPRGVRAGLGLRPFGGQLGNQLGGAAAEREPHPRVAVHGLPNAHGRGFQRLVRVQGLGAGEVEVPLVNRGPLNHRGEAPEHGGDGFGGRAAGAARHGDAHRVGAESQGLSDGHRRADAKGASLVGGGADDAASTGPTANNEQRRLASPLRICHTSDRHEEGVGIGEKNPACGHR